MTTISVLKVAGETVGVNTGTILPTISEFQQREWQWNWLSILEHPSQVLRYRKRSQEAISTRTTRSMWKELPVVSFRKQKMRYIDRRCTVVYRGRGLREKAEGKSRSCKGVRVTDTYSLQLVALVG